MIADPEDLIGESLPAEKPGRRSTRRGCRRGCLLSGFVVLLLLLVGVAGLGLPYTYWHRLGYAQVFEGPDRVVLFVEVERAMNRPGLFPGAYPSISPLRCCASTSTPTAASSGRPSNPISVTNSPSTRTCTRWCASRRILSRQDVRRRPDAHLQAGTEPNRSLSSSEALVAKGQAILHATTTRSTCRESTLSPWAGDTATQSRAWPWAVPADWPGPAESTRHSLRFRHVPRWLPESERNRSSPNRYPRPIAGPGAGRGGHATLEVVQEPSDRVLAIELRRLARAVEGR